jgi:flagellar assembly protein FliH
MSSSSSAPTRRVLRAADLADGTAVGTAGGTAVGTAGGVLGLDLRPEGLRRLDPRRVDEAVAAGRAAGHAAGFEAGLAEGRAQAAEEAAAALAATRARLDQLLGAAAAALSEVERQHQAALDAMADRAAEVAFAVAEAVVGRELALAEAPGRDAVARALAAAGAGAGELVVHLHPADAETLTGPTLAGGRPVAVVADGSVEPGGCVARSGTTTVDARIATALERVRAVLLGGAP